MCSRARTLRLWVQFVMGRGERAPRIPALGPRRSQPLRLKGVGRRRPQPPLRLREGGGAPRVPLSVVVEGRCLWSWARLSPKRRLERRAAPRRCRWRLWGLPAALCANSRARLADRIWKTPGGLSPSRVGAANNGGLSSAGHDRSTLRARCSSETMGEAREREKDTESEPVGVPLRTREATCHTRQHNKRGRALSSESLEIECEGVFK